MGGYLSNSVVLAVDNDVSGTLGISGSSNIGVYGGTNTAVLPPQGCPTTNCPVPNLVSSSSDPGLLPAFSSINASLASYSTSLEAEAATSTNIAFDPTPNSTLILTGTASDVNVFDVEASVLEGTVNLYIDVPAGSSPVINVDGDLDCSSTPCLQSVSYWNGTAYEQGGSYNSSTVESLRLNTLLNFYDATTINLDSRGSPSTSLRPEPTLPSIVVRCSGMSMPTRSTARSKMNCLGVRRRHLRRPLPLPLPPPPLAPRPLPPHRLSPHRLSPHRL